MEGSFTTSTSALHVENGVADVLEIINVVLIRYGMNIKAGNANTVKLGGILEVANGELEMIVQVVLILTKTRVGRRSLESDGVSGFGE